MRDIDRERGRERKREQEGSPDRKIEDGIERWRGERERNLYLYTICYTIYEFFTA